jgi:hypothetical protein
MSLTLLAVQVLTAALSTDPFAFFQPSVTLTADERAQLHRGEPVARVVPSRHREVAIFAAVPIDIDGDRLVAWMRRIEELKKSSYVLSIGRFSVTPGIEDLAGLVLDDADLSDIRTCRPGSCGLKLSATELTQAQRAAAEAGADWKSALQQAFRQIVLQRVQAYLASGLAVLPPYVDNPDQAWPASRFSLLLAHSLFLTEHAPDFAAYLSHYPQVPIPEVESFVYWSKERLARKAIISATHVSILRSRAAGLPDALVAGKEIFATHYVSGSLGVTAILHGEPDGHNYLAYLNRSEVDVLGGVFGGLVKWVVQRRLRVESRTVLQGLRRRLESGEPPPAIVTGTR